MNYDDITATIWPPAFTLKKNARTRHIKLKASAKHGLELCVPLRFNQKHIPEILSTNREWIEKQLLKIQQELLITESQTLPHEIHLAAIKQTWKVIYTPSDSKKLRLFVRPQQELVLYGNINDKKLCQKILSKWVKSLATTILAEQIKHLSERINLPYTIVTVRSQHTRWGSCSSNKKINLNYKLIFLPTDLTNHILVHELCHTKHMNHSVKFWHAVAAIDPDWKKHSSEIRKADHYVPWWAL